MPACNEGYIIEYVVLGGNMKVTAFDPKTLREVSIIGSPNASKKDMAKLAIRKLHYVLRNESKKK